MTSLEECLQSYSTMGLNVIPLKRGSKRSEMDWKKYQAEKFSDYDRFRSGDIDVGIICGAISDNLVVLDFDNQEFYKKFFTEQEREKLLTSTIVVESQPGHVHVYFRNDKSIATRHYHDLGLDVQSEGAYVRAVPSIHEKSGKPYRFISDRQDSIQQMKDLDLFIVGRLAELGISSKERRPFKEIWKGVSAGERHKEALRLALTYVHVSGLKDPESVLAELRRWGQLCKPPFDNEGDLKRIVEASFKYQFPNEESDLDEIEEKEKLEPISDEVRKKASDILHSSPSPLFELRKSLDNVIIREVRNKVYCFLVLLSGVRKDPKQKQIIVLKGNPGGGKSNIANILTSAFKTKKVARFSATALDYTDLENYEILYIQELLDLENQERMGMSTIRFLSGDDEGYSVEVTVRNKETGKMEVVQRKIPSMTVITTSTAYNLEAQFERRTHTINIDQTKDTTRKVIGFKADLLASEYDKALGAVTEENVPHLLRAMKEELQECEVVISTPRTLAHVLNSGELRSRSDFDKIATLTRLIAWFHQFQRPYSLIEGKKYVFSLPQDAYFALEIGRQPIIAMSTGLEERAINALKAINNLKDASVEHKGVNVTGFTQRHFFEEYQKISQSGESDQTIRRLLHTLQEKGIVAPAPESTRVFYIWQVSLPRNEFDDLLKLATTPNLSELYSEELEDEAKKTFERYRLSVPREFLKVVSETWFDSQNTDSLDNFGRKRDFAVFQKPLAEHRRASHTP